VGSSNINLAYFLKRRDSRVEPNHVTGS